MQSCGSVGNDLLVRSLLEDAASDGITGLTILIGIVAGEDMIQVRILTTDRVDEVVRYRGHDDHDFLTSFDVFVQVRLEL